jgi:hypothetical protein
MTRAWIRREARPGERVAVGAAAVVAGAVVAAAVWYVGRLLVAREPLELAAPPAPRAAIPRRAGAEGGRAPAPAAEGRELP